MQLIDFKVITKGAPRSRGWGKHGFIILLSLLASACMVQPIKRENLRDPAIGVIREAFVQLLKRAKSDPKHDWHNGRTGNMVVNTVGGNNVGLCYQWQELVYVGIQPALRKTGWRALGVSINKGTYFEHHAVVVFNPKKINPDTLLQHPGQAGVYVLDPWESGKPYIYTLADWLQKPWIIKVPAKITEIRQFTITGYKP